jgi:hypothetical protein
MFKNGEYINCVACELCFSRMIKPNQIYCKKCHAKIHSNKVSNSKVFKIDFNKSSCSLISIKNVTQKYIGKHYLVIFACLTEIS